MIPQTLSSWLAWKKPSQNENIYLESSAQSNFMPWSSKSFKANVQILYRNVNFDHFFL